MRTSIIQMNATDNALAEPNEQAIIFVFKSAIHIIAQLILNFSSGIANEYSQYAIKRQIIKQYQDACAEACIDIVEVVATARAKQCGNLNLKDEFIKKYEAVVNPIFQEPVRSIDALHKKLDNAFSTIAVDMPFSKENALNQNQSYPDRNTSLEQAVVAIIQELRENWRVEHPTKVEQILQFIQTRANQVITIDELIPFFEGTKDPEKQARNFVAKLNTKLATYNVRLDHVTAFRITEIPIPND